jgi:hypothetical protein
MARAPVRAEGKGATMFELRSSLSLADVNVHEGRVALATSRAFS